MAGPLLAVRQRLNAITTCSFCNSAATRVHWRILRMRIRAWPRHFRGIRL